MIMANIIHFISSPYLMMYNSFSKLNENLEAVGHTLGISRGHMIKDVFIPTCKGTIVEMFSYFFVNKAYAFIMLGVLLVYPVLKLYNGERGKAKWMKWFFYIFYPVHMAALYLLSMVL